MPAKQAVLIVEDERSDPGEIDRLGLKRAGGFEVGQAEDCRDARAAQGGCGPDLLDALVDGFCRT